MKKLLLMVLLLTALTANSFAREGVQIVLQTKDGRTISGELLAVKHHCLILKDASGAGATADVDDLALVKYQRGTRWAGGLGIGLVIGLAIGGAVGYVAGPEGRPHSWASGLGKAVYATLGASIGAVMGTIVGAHIGSRQAIYKSVDLSDAGPLVIEDLLLELRRKTRFPEESY